jgi:hypothetical protein
MMILGDDPRPDCDNTRTLLHAVDDWPGHLPEGPASVAALVTAGADVNAHADAGHHRETALQWAASDDDVAVLDAGADIEAAHRLLERAPAPPCGRPSPLGLTDGVEAHLAADPPPSVEDVTGAFWAASLGRG